MKIVMAALYSYIAALYFAGTLAALELAFG